MSMSDAMQAHNQAMQPVLDAIDGAMRSGKVDPESLMEAIEGHVGWWVDELWAAENAGA